MGVTKAARLDVYDEGVLQGNVTELDIVGSAYSVVVTGDRATLTGVTGSGVFVVSTEEVDLGSTPRRSGRFDISGLSGLTPGNGVLIQQALGPYTGKGTQADEAEMDRILPVAKAASSSEIQVFWSSSTLVKGNFKFDYSP